MVLPEHSHCNFCGDPILFGDDYCSEECRTMDEAKQNKESKRTNIFFILAIAAIVVLTAIIYITS